MIARRETGDLRLRELWDENGCAALSGNGLKPVVLPRRGGMGCSRCRMNGLAWVPGAVARSLQGRASQLLHSCLTVASLSIRFPQRLKQRQRRRSYCRRRGRQN